MPGFLSRIDRSIDLTERAMDVLAGAGLIAMMTVISCDALGRYFLNAPVQGAFELTSLYLMVVVAFFALPRSYRTGAQIRLELIDGWLARIPWQLSRRIAALLSCTVFSVLTVVTMEEAIAKTAALESSFGVIQWPLYLSYAWLPLGCLVLTLRLGLEVLRPPQPALQEDIAE